MGKATAWLSSIRTAFAPDGAVSAYSGYLWCIGYCLIQELRGKLERPPRTAAELVKEYQDFMEVAVYRNPLSKTCFDEFFRACQCFVNERMKLRMYPEQPNRLIEAENRLQDAGYDLISKVHKASEVTVISRASLDPRLPLVLDFALELAKLKA